MGAPKFSIAIPVYNRADYLRQALVSCLSQTTGDFEVVVSDDCSSEDLEPTVDAFRDSRLRYHRSSERLGAVKNHQRAVSLSRGRYAITLNSDDMLLPNCLEAAGEALDTHPAAAAVYFACAYLKGAEVIGASRLPAVGFADAEGLAQHPWLHRFHGTGPSCCLFSKVAFDRLGGYRTFLRLAYDWDLYLRFLTAGGGVVFLPEALCLYRLHDEQMVQTSSIDGLWDMLDLWREPENRHWPAKDLARLVFAQCSLKLRAGQGLGGIAAMLLEIQRRGSGLRLLGGAPAAAWDRLRRAGEPTREDETFYVRPSNLPSALDHSGRLLALAGVG